MESKNQFKEQMQRVFERGRKERDKLIQQVQDTLIVDRLVPPAKMMFVAAPDLARDITHLGLVYAGKEEPPYRIHKHALSQLCQKVRLPIEYLHTLEGYYDKRSDPWSIQLLAQNLTTLYHSMTFKQLQPRTERESGEAPKFLHRIVGQELRGFVSRKFNRQIASAPLLDAFISACDSVGAEPVEGLATPVKYSLRCVHPHVYEPVDGYPLCLGVSWSNSDFGAGSLSIAVVVYRPHTGSSWVLDNVLNRIHIGSVLSDNDLVEVSAETASHELQAQSSAIRDSVRHHLTEAAVQRVLTAIEKAHEEHIPWSKLKTQFARILTKAEVESLKKVLDDDEIEDLPPVRRVNQDNPEPSRLWAMVSLERLAALENDVERKFELQQFAGSMLKP